MISVVYQHNQDYLSDTGKKVARTLIAIRTRQAKQLQKEAEALDKIFV